MVGRSDSGQATALGRDIVSVARSFLNLLLHPKKNPALAIAAWLGIAGAGTLFCILVWYSYWIGKVKSGSFQTFSEVYAAPRLIRVGDELTAAGVIRYLQRSGYSETPNKDRGHYTRRGSALQIAPGPVSYFTQEPIQISFSSAGGISEIRSLANNRVYNSVLLEPELISNLPDKNRVKKRSVRFADIPPVLVQAVVAVEDRHFFQHGGFDLFRIAKAAYVDLREHRKDQGASTLSMQLARGLFLGREKTWARKLREALVTMLLEARFSKQEIFESYANSVYLGQWGTFSVHGFAEASRDYFGKDLRQLSLSEAALLAGLIQRPSYLNPFRWPDRAQARRQIVLAAMLDSRSITQQQYEAAVNAPLRLATRTMESTDAPFFLDLVNESISSTMSDPDFHASSHRIYTSLDLDLQREAAAAVHLWMAQVDARLHKRNRTDARPQVALIALDVSTGALKALVGGRDYAASQLNHASARRQPGSAFKPFVYAAGLGAALKRRGDGITPATLLTDEPTTFWFHNQPYTPANFHDQFHGTVTVREAISESMNVPAVKVAEAAGYDNVAKLAKQAGLSVPTPATPAIALGAYEVTPLELAGAYTIFARQGNAIRPNWITQIRNPDGSIIAPPRPPDEPVLDPRIAYLMINLMEDVLRSGTAAGARAGGFSLPAAGKTGTSRDGWFAGFTSNLLCVVWVGFDDGRDLKLEGANSALPIWTEFMNRAHKYPQYRDAKPFATPPGIDSVTIDPTSGELATSQCPAVRTEVFLSGTQPRDSCHLHPDPDKGVKGFFRRIWGVFK